MKCPTRTMVFPISHNNIINIIQLGYGKRHRQQSSKIHNTWILNRIKRGYIEMEGEKEVTILLLTDRDGREHPMRLNKQTAQEIIEIMRNVK